MFQSDPGKVSISLTGKLFRRDGRNGGTEVLIVLNPKDFFSVLDAVYTS